MNDQNKIKLLTGLVFALVVLNVVVLGYMWFAPHGGRPGGPRDGRAPGGLVIKELKFDDSQQKQFESLRNGHHTAMVKIGETSRHLHDQLFSSLATASDTSAVADSLISDIAKLEIEKEKITYHHLRLVRQMCNANQQKAFDDMIAKAMAKNHREDGPPPPRD